MAEIIRKVDVSWMQVRKHELRDYIIEKEQEHIEEELVTQEPLRTGSREKIIEFIKQNDKGKGVGVEEMAKNFPDIEKIIEDMLKEGELFENSPGQVKVLE